MGSSMLLLGCKSPLFWAGVASIACVMLSKHLHLIANHMSCSAAGAGCAAAAALAAMRSPICALMQLQPAVRQAIGLYWTQRCLMLPIAMLNMGVSGLLQVCCYHQACIMCHEQASGLLQLCVCTACMFARRQISSYAAASHLVSSAMHLNCCGSSARAALYLSVSEASMLLHGCRDTTLWPSVQRSLVHRQSWMLWGAA